MKFNKNIPAASMIIGLFGLIVIASGFWRVLSAEGGEKGLWFGIVMGGTALFSGGLFIVNRERLANVVAWSSMLVVGGWFCYESFCRKGFADAEPRQLLVIVATATTGLVLIRVTSKTPERSGE